MTKLKVPSLQHLSRNWRSDPEDIRRLLVQLVKNSPTFNYSPVFAAVRDMLVFSQPYETVAEGFRRYIGRKTVRENFLEVLALMHDHFCRVNVDFVHAIQPRFYPIARGLLVPFQPPIVYGVNGRIYFPWMSFWRNNPLSGERLSLFVSVVEQVLLQDPDLEGAVFQILDCSAASSDNPRTLTVVDAASVPRISSERRAEMLSTFAHGYLLARAELAGVAEDRVRESSRDPKQPGLFDGDG